MKQKVIKDAKKEKVEYKTAFRERVINESKATVQQLEKKTADYEKQVLEYVFTSVMLKSSGVFCSFATISVTLKLI